MFGLSRQEQVVCVLELCGVWLVVRCTGGMGQVEDRVTEQEAVMVPQVGTEWNGGKVDCL